jgi:AraC family transcriptional regulator
MTSLPVIEPGSSVQLADYSPGALFGPRQLTDFEFVWLLRGSAVWSTYDVDPSDRVTEGDARLLLPNTLALATAGTIDSYHWDDNQLSTHAYVHFQLAKAGGLGPESTWPKIRSLASCPVLAGICAYLLDLAGQESVAARSRSDQLVGLLLDLFVTGPFEEPDQALHPYVVAVQQYARRAWQADGPRLISADELAAAVSISAGHLFRLFRTAYGCGPARAFELVRLARSAVAVQRTNASLGEIAHRGGFANAYHFSRRFTLVYRRPPGAYRALGLGPDPLEPVRKAGLLRFAAPLMSSAAAD